MSNATLTATELTATELTATELDEVRAILMLDPVWAAYALADLQPYHLPHCRWIPVTGEGAGTGSGMVLVYSGYDTPFLLTFGGVAAVEQALAAPGLPDYAYISVRQEHLPAVQVRYDVTGDLRPMLRMRLADPAACLVAEKPRGDGLVTGRLAGADAERVLRLLAHGGPFTPDAFAPAQIDAGVFFGVTDVDGELCAVGGTHIVDWDSGVGAVGNMYTRPDMRRRGLAASVLAAIVRELHAQEIRTIVLNVDQRNPGAQAMYEAHGFVVHIPYWEGKGPRYA